MFTNTLRAIRKRPPEWSVILNPIPDEVSKQTIINKIVDIFPITHSEVEELVERTPVILLESLSEGDAARLKDYFARADIDVAISNDVSIRRRCYRTVWPEQPSLAFLNVRAHHAVEETAQSSRAHAHAESFSPHNKSSASDESDRLERHPRPGTPVPRVSRPTQTKEEYGMPPQPHPSPYPSESISVRQRDVIVDQLKEKLFAAEEKAEFLEQSNMKLKEEILLAEKQNAERLTAENMSNAQDQFDSISLEQEKKHALMEERVERLEEERDELRSELAELRSAYSDSEQQRDRWRSERDEWQRKLGEQTHELEELRILVKQRQEVEKENGHLIARLERLETDNEDLAKKYRDADQQRRALSDRVSVAESESERVRKESAIERTQFQEEVTHMQKTYEIERIQLRKELEQVRKRCQELESKASENRRLQEELDQARTRLREFTLNREQQEAIQKRLRLQNELIEKEARLKELVKKQEIVEREIVERGQVIQQVLSEQEEIERDIVRSKQAHKYLTEQIKAKEKPRYSARARVEVKSPESFKEPRPI